MIEIPQKLIDAAANPKGEMKGGPSDAAKDKALSPPLYESDAPPPPPDAMKTAIPTPQWPSSNLYSNFDTGDHAELIAPVRLQVLGWEPASDADAIPITPRDMAGA